MYSILIAIYLPYSIKYIFSIIIIISCYIFMTSCYKIITIFCSFRVCAPSDKVISLSRKSVFWKCFYWLIYSKIFTIWSCWYYYLICSSIISFISYSCLFCRRSSSTCFFKLCSKNYFSFFFIWIIILNYFWWYFKATIWIIQSFNSFSVSSH